MVEYKVNVNFVAGGKDYFAGDVATFEAKEAARLNALGKELHPGLGEFLSLLHPPEETTEEAPKTKAKKAK